MGPPWESTWVLSAPDGPHVGPINLAFWVIYDNKVLLKIGNWSGGHRWCGPFCLNGVNGILLSICIGLSLVSVAIYKPSTEKTTRTDLWQFNNSRSGVILHAFVRFHRLLALNQWILYKLLMDEWLFMTEQKLWTKKRYWVNNLNENPRWNVDCSYIPHLNLYLDE